MPIGTVKFFVAQKGWGFITPDSGSSSGDVLQGRGCAFLSIGASDCTDMACNSGRSVE